MTTQKKILFCIAVIFTFILLASAKFLVAKPVSQVEQVVFETESVSETETGQSDIKEKKLEETEIVAVQEVQEVKETEEKKVTIETEESETESTKSMAATEELTKTPYSQAIQVLVTEEQKNRVETEVRQLDNEISMIAKVIYREARGISSDARKAAVGWCILNRVDASDYPSSISEVIRQPHQFAWVSDTPVTDELYSLSKDVVARWLLEKEGFENVGRTLPYTYLYFHGDGKENHFRKGFGGSTERWQWAWSSPYGN